MLAWSVPRISRVWFQIPLVRDAYKGKIYKVTYFSPAFNQGLACILTSMCDQAHPIQLGQPSLFTEAAKGLLSYLNINLQHSRKLSVLGQAGLTG